MRQIKKMGGMASIMSMMPGMPQMKGDMAVDDSAMDRVEAIILSPDEGRTCQSGNPESIQKTRESPEAQAWTSAKSTAFVKQFDQMRKMMKQLPGMMGGGKRKGGLGALGGMMGKV